MGESLGSIFALLDTELTPFHSDSDGLYRGDWKLNKSTGTVSGNPANAAVVMDLMKTLKNKFGAGGGSRSHTAAMTEPHMKAIHSHLMSICPGEAVPCKTLHDKDLRMRCLFFLAFSSLSWTLWTR